MKSDMVDLTAPEIREDFIKNYHTASEFVNRPLFGQCMGILGNKAYLKVLIECNDHGIPPAKLFFWLLEGHGVDVTGLTDEDRRCIGALIAFIFKELLHYDCQKDHAPAGDGSVIKTAALYSREATG